MTIVCRWVVAVFVLAPILAGSPLAAEAPRISLRANPTTASVGDTITVSINLENAPPFACWSSFLKFDGTSLKLTEQRSGTFSTFVRDSRTLAAINQVGEVRAGGFGMTNSSRGSGTMVVLTFEVLKPGRTMVTTANQSTANKFGTNLTSSDGTRTLPIISGPLVISAGGDRLDEGDAEHAGAGEPHGGAEGTTLKADDDGTGNSSKDPDEDVSENNESHAQTTTHHAGENSASGAGPIQSQNDPGVDNGNNGPDAGNDSGKDDTPGFDLIRNQQGSGAANGDEKLHVPNSSNNVFAPPPAPGQPSHDAGTPDGKDSPHAAGPSSEKDDAPGSNQGQDQHVADAVVRPDSSPAPNSSEEGVSAAVIPGEKGPDGEFDPEKVHPHEDAPSPYYDPLAIKDGAIEVFFGRRGKDEICLRGRLAVPDGFVPQDKQILIYVGGVQEDFKLNARGKARNGSNLFRIRVDAGKNDGGNANFVLKLRRGTFSSMLANEGMVNGTLQKVQVHVTAWFLLDGTIYATGSPAGTEPLAFWYWARKDSKGWARSVGP